MARTTETIDHWSCNLCGTGHEPAELRHVRGDPPGVANMGVQVDICEACQDRPIREVLEAIAAAEKAKGIRTVTVQRVAP
jgi:hypothetical protein